MIIITWSSLQSINCKRTQCNYHEPWMVIVDAIVLGSSRGKGQRRAKGPRLPKVKMAPAQAIALQKDRWSGPLGQRNGGIMARHVSGGNLRWKFLQLMVMTQGFLQIFPFYQSSWGYSSSPVDWSGAKIVAVYSSVLPIETGDDLKFQVLYQMLTAQNEPWHHLR